MVDVPPTDAHDLLGASGCTCEEQVHRARIGKLQEHGPLSVSTVGFTKNVQRRLGSVVGAGQPSAGGKRQQDRHDDGFLVLHDRVLTPVPLEGQCRSVAADPWFSVWLHLTDVSDGT